MFQFMRTAISDGVLRSSLYHPGAGGVVIFEGRVRNQHRGRSVLFLEYEAYEALAEREGLAILAEVREKYDILEVLCAHRTGKVELGEMAVWIGVAAVHRAPAFEACSFVIDAIKQRLPIWKKEFYGDGMAVWVNCKDETFPSATEKKIGMACHDHSR
ncbi:molybdenum cofactor biosynthesis protein MoaE [Leptospirillum ferrooxidans]|jgi:molybdopterin synthase catalytic subunit|uniref:Molybdopterin synthase catalytic subunit n=1 Tax=Leptospirillum ferrooxidans (strain C2-3) TaxID=1162668 RepID=I0ILP2_LEPFC|nr:molybdenum cofactor biosynthesis protein MoaE [Leptospirillum ferrooxidans]BAM06191.1 putative molybdopterin (MPT) converting factor, subunit 2 [Leptospirillum ferrooxidans C2-3]